MGESQARASGWLEPDRGASSGEGAWCLLSGGTLHGLQCSGHSHGRQQIRLQHHSPAVSGCPSQLRALVT
jgi:hypothetical protein